MTLKKSRKSSFRSRLLSGEELVGLFVKTPSHSIVEVMGNSNMDFFSTMISEEKFIDTVENLTIFVEEKDDFGNYKNIFLKDDFNIGNSKQKSQIIYAKKAVLIESGKVRYFKLFDGLLLDR
jgi:hypothetical protein